jgi:type III pantothenate kinase
MNLVIDVGNTLVKMAVFNRLEIIHHSSHPDLDINTIQKLIADFPEIRKCIVGSVRTILPGSAEKIRNIIDTLILEPGTRLPITHKYKTFETLGIDRIAGVVAANNMFPGKNVLLIETGTCITYDFIDDRGVYHGGGISPGIRMRFKALHTFTDKLPFIEPEKDTALIGNTTEKSIRSGVINGIKAEVQGIISSYEDNYENLTIILSGGDIDYFDKNLKNNIFAVPNIVLTGLNIILEFNDKN